MSSKTKPKKTTSEERIELLERLWAAHTRKLVEKIENTPATDIDAATFNAAAKMLAENGITADALNKDYKQAGKSLAEEARNIMAFDDPTPDNSLRASLGAPVPIPPMTEETITALKRLEDN